MGEGESLEDLRADHEFCLVYMNNETFYRGHSLKDATDECLRHKAYLLHLRRNMQGADSFSAHLYGELNGELKHYNELSLQGLPLAVMKGFLEETITASTD